MQDIDITTEDYAISRENEHIREYAIRDHYYPSFRKLVSLLLKDGSQNSRQKLIELFDRKDNYEFFHNEPEYAQMYIIIQIYSKELNANLPNSILDISDNIEYYIIFIRQIKFLLWRIEFAEDATAAEQLIVLINKFHLSPFFITRLLETCAFTINLFISLTDIFIDRKMLDLAQAVIEITNQFFVKDT